MKALSYEDDEAAVGLEKVILKPTFCVETHLSPVK
jgi:hypothetical protein